MRLKRKPSISSFNYAISINELLSIEGRIKNSISIFASFDAKSAIDWALFKMTEFIPKPWAREAVNEKHI